MITQANLDAARETVRDCVIRVRDFHLSFEMAMYSGGRLRENPGEGWEVVIEELATAYEKAREMLWNGPAVRRERKQPYGPPVDRHPGELADAIVLAREGEMVEIADSKGQTIKGRSYHEMAVLVASRVLSATLFISDGPITMTVKGARTVVRFLHDDEREWKPTLEEVPQFDCEPVLIELDGEWSKARAWLADEGDDWSEAKTPTDWQSIFNVSASTFQRMRRDGRLRVDPINAKLCRIHKEDVEKYTPK